MKIAVIGNDRRFLQLSQLLYQLGYDTGCRTEDAQLTVTAWPPSEKLGNGRIASCGPQYAPEGVIDLLKDEDYQRDIACMTAEGAISAAMTSDNCALRGTECLVVGWGRIGRALTEMLIGLGANVTVLTRRADAQREIEASGAHAAFTADAAAQLPGKKFVFSTPPAMVLDQSALIHADRGAVLIDLASPPYGVDIQAAERLELRAWREPGLPGRYCPKNAAAAIYRALVRSGALAESGGGFDG